MVLFFFKWKYSNTIQVQDNICHNHKHYTEVYRNASQIYGNLAYSWEMPRVIPVEGMDKDITGITFYCWFLLYILCIWNLSLLLKGK